MLAEGFSFTMVKMRKHGLKGSLSFNWIKRETEGKRAKVCVKSDPETYLWSTSADRRPVVIKH